MPHLGKNEKNGLRPIWKQVICQNGKHVFAYANATFKGFTSVLGCLNDC